MVNADDETLKQNRLALLSQVRKLFECGGYWAASIVKINDKCPIIEYNSQPW